MVGAKRCHRGPCRCGDSRSPLGGRETPVEMIWRCGRPPTGIKVRNERIDAEDITTIGGVPVTTPERTAFDLARHLPRDLAVAHLDALARATGITAPRIHLLADRYPRARGFPARPNRVGADGRRSAITARDTAATDSHRRRLAAAAHSNQGERRNEPRRSSIWATTSRRSASTTRAHITARYAINTFTTSGEQN